MAVSLLGVFKFWTLQCPEQMQVLQYLTLYALADGWVLIGGAPAAGARSGSARGGGGGGAALTRAPTLPGNFPELRAMAAGELAGLAADEAHFAAFVRKLAAASGVQQARWPQGTREQPAQSAWQGVLWLPARLGARLWSAAGALGLVISSSPGAWPIVWSIQRPACWRRCNPRPAGGMTGSQRLQCQGHVSSEAASASLHGACGRRCKRSCARAMRTWHAARWRARRTSASCATRSPSSGAHPPKCSSL